MSFYKRIYKVEGSTPFPIDMLRFDGSFPRSGIDSGRIDQTLNYNNDGKVVVELVQYSDLKISDGSRDKRWESFGWKVIDTHIVGMEE